MSGRLDDPSTSFHPLPDGATDRIGSDRERRREPGLYLVDEKDGFYLCIEFGIDQPPNWRIFDKSGREREIITGEASFAPIDRLEEAAAEVANGTVLAVVDGGTPPTTPKDAYVCTANSDGGYTCWKQ